MSKEIEKKEVEAKSSITNVGSSEYQVSVFTNRIKSLTDHLKINKKDHNTRRGLMKLVGKRKKLIGLKSMQAMKLVNFMEHITISLKILLKQSNTLV